MVGTFVVGSTDVEMVGSFMVGSFVTGSENFERKKISFRKEKRENDELFSTSISLARHIALIFGLGQTLCGVKGTLLEKNLMMMMMMMIIWNQNGDKRILF